MAKEIGAAVLLTKVRLCDTLAVPVLIEPKANGELGVIRIALGAEAAILATLGFTVLVGVLIASLKIVS